MRRVGQQNQNVDVGVRRQFAAPIAADGQQRQIGRQFAGVPGGAQRVVVARARAAISASTLVAVLKRSSNWALATL